ncbi:hypothetical protein BD413DRAFT_81968 [Trametes elegans]|nr:hypothetical protein BD413DRAFT_81968 [Trametes elegans]
MRFNLWVSSDSAHTPTTHRRAGPIGHTSGPMCFFIETDPVFCISTACASRWATALHRLRSTHFPHGNPQGKCRHVQITLIRGMLYSPSYAMSVLRFTSLWARGEVYRTNGRVVVSPNAIKPGCYEHLSLSSSPRLATAAPFRSGIALLLL